MKDVNYARLYEIYGELLTKRQQEAVEMYYSLDLSLLEIASIMKVSRQAVADFLKKSRQELDSLEQKLGLFAKEVKLLAFSEKLEPSLKKELNEILEN